MLDRKLMAAAIAAISTAAAMAPITASAQSVQALKNPPPDGAQLTFLLQQTKWRFSVGATDGICHAQKTTRQATATWASAGLVRYKCNVKRCIS